MAGLRKKVRQVSKFVHAFFLLSARTDKVLYPATYDSLPIVKGQTRRKAGTQSFRSVSGR